MFKLDDKVKIIQNDNYKDDPSQNNIGAIGIITRIEGDDYFLIKLITKDIIVSCMIDEIELCEHSYNIEEIMDNLTKLESKYGI